MKRSLKIFILSCWLLTPALSCLGQLVDDFADNNFTADPLWTGVESNFVIDNFQLRLQAPVVNGTAYLSTESHSINNAMWEFTLKLDFNPSGTNYARIYLVSSNGDLSGSLNGYFVLVGDTPDEISLYRQSGAATSKIIDGADGSVNISVVNAAIRVTRDDLGNWELFSDVGLSGAFVSQGSVFDNTFNSSDYFGVYCNYTSTRSDKFYFDNFVVTGDPYIDLDPPVVEQIEVTSSNSVIVHFDELLNIASSTQLDNYIVNNDIGHPNLATLLSDAKSVELAFDQTFKNGFTHNLEISDVTDLAGNLISQISQSFLYFFQLPVNNKDLIISEIFADQSPQVGLPDAEYIEVYNRSENPINLNGWKFTDGSSVATLPDKIMLPNDYLILTSTSNVAKFGLTANVLGIANFPTLNNTSDNLVLKESGDQTIDSVAYDLSWYRNSDKEEGGWSLEIIDPNNICSEAENWTSSENESGGTPGKINSVFANKPDLTGPQLISVSVQAANKVLLTFNEKLEKQISGSVSFLISPNPEIAVYYFENPTLRSIILELSSALVTKQLYTVTVTGLYDCSGNVMDPEKNKLTFALPEEAEVSDILINEILFNPRPNGVDFVELYNNSSKYIDLKDWSVGNFTDGLVENSKLLFSTPQIIAPGEYLTLTSDPLVLKNNYPQGKENAFYKTTLPSLPDDEGSIAIVSSQGEVIDYFLYDKNLHSELLKDDEGVSLERISFSENTNNNANWTSATSVSGFATPGFQNSNLRLDNNLLSDEVTINPVVFNPNAGNFSQINFRFNQGGFVANVKILDHHGRLIKTLANNSTIGQEGFFRWDGDQDGGGKARTGYYVVWFEVFDITGIQKTFRKRIVLASL